MVISALAARPCLVSSSRSAVSTPSDESARQPVPPQTEIHGLSAACPAMIAARQASNSAIDCSLALILGPLSVICEDVWLTAVLLQDELDLAGDHFAVVRAIHHHYRPQCAAAEAVHRLQRELAVLGGFPWSHLQHARSLVHQALTAAHVASGAQADGNHVLAARLEAEGLVEAGHLVDLDGRPTGLVGHALHGLFRQVVEFSLHVQEEGDERTAFAAMPGDDGIHLTQFDPHRATPMVLLTTRRQPCSERGGWGLKRANGEDDAPLCAPPLVAIRKVAPLGSATGQSHLFRMDA